MDGVFLGLAGCSSEQPCSPASPRKTPSIPPLLLGLTQSERVGGGGEEEDCSKQLKEEGRHSLPSQI